MKKILNVFIMLCLVTVLFSCQKVDHTIILGTTTSTDNSGLLNYLMPFFKEDTGITVNWVAVGTGAALQMGRSGDADILMVHDKPNELIFMQDGYGSQRSDFMYNDFVIVGPTNSTITGDSMESVLDQIVDTGKFISRGDNSGTNSKELFLWDKYGIENTGDWYVESGSGMGATLTMANELGAYTLTDRATYLSMKDQFDLKIVYENDPDLFNQYGVIIVNPDLHKNLNTKDASVLYNWLLSDRGQTLINAYGIDTYGQELFFGNAPQE